MTKEGEEWRRVHFYGVRDLAAGVYAPRAAELAISFDGAIPANAVDALELHNVQKYLEHGLIPTSYSEGEVQRIKAQIPRIQSSVARFFASIDSRNVTTRLADIGHQYHADLLDLLGRNKVFERCDGPTMLATLVAMKVHLSTLLTNKSIVSAYDQLLREQILAAPHNAEILVRKFLNASEKKPIFLPTTLTAEDSRALLEAYLEDDQANSNYLRLISTANDDARAGIDAKLRLKAKRRNEELVSRFFDQNVGLKTGCEISLSADQEEPVLSTIDTSDGSVWQYTYSEKWLEATTDHASILNNFQHLFEFTDHQVVLTLPAYPAHLGVMERFMGVTGKTEYKTGVVFQTIDARSLLQTHFYRKFLQSREIEIESVIAWFFEEYLVEEFGAMNFSFSPSTDGAPFLQRVRNLFAEMESVANQFSMFARDGFLDRDLLTMGTDQVRFKEIPSQVEGKYVYPVEGSEVVHVLDLLFSDQSYLNYVNEDLNDNTATELFLRNRVSYANLETFQQAGIDHLTRLGVIQEARDQIRFRSMDQLSVLSTLFNAQAVSYYHLSPTARSEVDDMISKGWLTRKSSLLTDAEVDYFNYFLNKVGYSNGPNLRNRYLHGSQAHTDGEDAHFNTYIIALRLLIALVIKTNDDFVIKAGGGHPAGRSSK